MCVLTSLWSCRASAPSKGPPFVVPLQKDVSMLKGGYQCWWYVPVMHVVGLDSLRSLQLVISCRSRFLPRVLRTFLDPVRPCHHNFFAVVYFPFRHRRLVPNTLIAFYLRAFACTHSTTMYYRVTLTINGVFIQYWIPIDVKAK